MYKLIVIWDTGEKQVYAYKTEAKAEQAAINLKFAFGKQIEWTGITRAWDKCYASKEA